MKIAQLRVQYQDEVTHLHVRVDLKRGGEYFYKQYTFSCDTPEQRSQWETWVVGMQEALSAINVAQDGFPIVRSPLRYTTAKPNKVTGGLTDQQAPVTAPLSTLPAEVADQPQRHESMVEFISYAGMPVDQIGQLTVRQWCAKFRDFATRLSVLHQHNVFFVDISEDNLLVHQDHLYQADIDSSIVVHQGISRDAVRDLVRAKDGYIVPLVEQRVNDDYGQGADGVLADLDVSQVLARQDAWAFMVTVMRVVSRQQQHVPGLTAENLSFLKAQIASGVPIASSGTLTAGNVVAKNLARVCLANPGAGFDVEQTLHRFLDELENVAGQDRQRSTANPHAAASQDAPKDQMIRAVRSVERTGVRAGDADAALAAYFTSRALAIRSDVLRDVWSKVLVSVILGIILGIIVGRLLP